MVQIAQAATDAPSGGWEELAPDAKKTRGTLLWDILFYGDMAMLATLLLVTVIVSLLDATGIYSPASEGSTRAGLWGATIFSLVALGIIPFVWLLGTRVQPWRGTLRYLQMEKPWPAVAEGVLWVIGMFIVVIGFTAAYTEIVGKETENPVLDETLSLMTWPLAIAFAFSAAFGEEILFRGILQKKIGLWGQAIVFGIAHAGYGTVPQIVLPFFIGLAYGYIIKRGRSLWVAISSHFLFDFIAASSPLWSV